jgi:hypothetical protein
VLCVVCVVSCVCRVCRTNGGSDVLEEVLEGKLHIGGVQCLVIGRRVGLALAVTLRLLLRRRARPPLGLHTHVTSATYRRIHCDAESVAYLLVVLQVVHQVGVETRLGQGEQGVQQVEAPPDLVVVDQAARVGAVDGVLLPSLPSRVGGQA